MMETTFWQPGTRCTVRRYPHRTVVDITSTKDNAGDCSVKIQWQGLDKRGLAAMPPVSICSGAVRLLEVSSAKFCEGRLILPPISDDIWPQCYLSIVRRNDAARAQDGESSSPVSDDATSQS